MLLRLITFEASYFPLAFASREYRYSRREAAAAYVIDDRAKSRYRHYRVYIITQSEYRSFTLLIFFAAFGTSCSVTLRRRISACQYAASFSFRHFAALGCSISPPSGRALIELAHDSRHYFYIPRFLYDAQAFPAHTVNFPRRRLLFL